MSADTAGKLNEAVMNGQINVVREILKSNPLCVNDRFICYRTVLHHVFMDCHDLEEANRLAIMKILLDHGADVNAHDRFGKTPLYFIAEYGQAEAIKMMLEHGADPNSSDKFTHKTILYEAYDDSEIKLLLQYGARIDVLDHFGHTPLDVAIDVGDLEIAKILVDEGTKARDLFNLVRESTDETEESEELMKVKFLLKHGFEIDFYRRFSVKALYFSSLASPNAQIIEKVMLEQGIDIDGLKREGAEMTKLHVAVSNKDEHEVRALLEAGAHVNAKNVVYETPLHCLFDPEENSDHDKLYRIARLLVEAGADLYAKNCLNYTPFQLALARKYSKIVIYMLAKTTGVEESTLPDQMDLKLLLLGSFRRAQLFCPLSIAIIFGYEEAVNNYIDLHNVETSNDTSEELFRLAVRHRQYGIVKILLEAECRVNSYFTCLPRECDINDMKCLCLLRDFHGIMILKNLILDAIKMINTSSNSGKAEELLIFYYKIGLHSNKLNKDFISMTGYYYPNKRLSTILDYFDAQIAELKKDTVCGSLSKFDMLTIKLDSLVSILNDENNLKACIKLCSSFDENQEIESYQFALKMRFDLALEKRRLLDSAKNFLNETFKTVLDFVKLESLPDEIMGIILSYLNVRELKKIVKND